ncbi:MAG: metallophosphoesterase family protein [Nitrospinales bacterium]
MESTNSTDLKIAQITDIHLPRNKQLRVQDVDTYGTLDKMLGIISDFSPDLVLVTGDIAEEGGEEPFRALKEMLEPFPNTLVTPGNHDLGHEYGRYFNDASYQVRHLDDWTLLAINTAELDISDETMSACQRILEENERVLLATHHPLVSVGTPFFDQIHTLRNREKHWKSLISYPSLKAAVFGHIHFQHRSQHGHVQAIGAPAVSFEIIGNSEDTKIEIFKRHGFQLLTLTDNVSAETHFL